MVDDGAESDLIPPSFDQHPLVLLVRPQNAPNLDEDQLQRLQNEHLAYLRDLGRAGILIANGPLTEQTDERFMPSHRMRPVELHKPIRWSVPADWPSKSRCGGRPKGRSAYRPVSGPGRLERRAYHP